MVKIKICGLTNYDDALCSANLGADILGFIFTESKRKISPVKAKKIINSLPRNKVQTAGVFYNQSLKDILNIAYFSEIDIIQLHGNEPPELCRHIKNKIIKRIKINKNSNRKIILSKIRKYRVSYFLLDPGKGDGKTFDWKIASFIKYPIFLAGGLNPSNINKALKTVKPFGVDVCSGVEKKPGKKDPDKLENFINIVKKFKEFNYAKFAG